MDAKKNTNFQVNNLHIKTSDAFLKCPQCYKIPEITKSYWNNFNYKCNNNHKEELKLNELLNKCTTSKILYKCSYGNESNTEENYLLFNLCYKCKKIICSEKKCQKAHRTECSDDLDNLINCKDLSSLCYEHGEKLLFYCPKCDINVCVNCQGHEDHNIVLMNTMKIEEKKLKLYYYKIEFTNHYLNYIEKEISNFKKEWKDDFERSMKFLDEKVKKFLDINREQIKLIQSILNTYKKRGNISIENYKNIKAFCDIPEFKFILPDEIKEKKKFIEDFSNNFLIKIEYQCSKGKPLKGGKKCEAEKHEQIKLANEETVSLILNKLNELYEINKIENEEKIKKSIEYVLNDYLNKNEIFNDNHNWYENIIKNNFWEIINHLPEI